MPLVMSLGGAPDLLPSPLMTSSSFEHRGRMMQCLMIVYSFDYWTADHFVGGPRSQEYTDSHCPAHEALLHPTPSLCQLIHNTLLVFTQFCSQPMTACFEKCLRLLVHINTSISSFQPSACAALLYRRTKKLVYLFATRNTSIQFSIMSWWNPL